MIIQKRNSSIFVASDVPFNTHLQRERVKNIYFTGATHLTMCYKWLRRCFHAPYFFLSSYTKTATI